MPQRVRSGADGPRQCAEVDTLRNMYVCSEPVALHDASLYVLRRGGSGVHVHVVGVTDARSRCNKH